MGHMGHSRNTEQSCDVGHGCCPTHMPAQSTACFLYTTHKAGCGCADEAYMIPSTLGLDINTKRMHLQPLARQDKERQGWGPAKGPVRTVPQVGLEPASICI